MDLAVADSLAPEAQPIFTDGFGERRQAIGARGERLEVLRLSSALGDISLFELSVRDRVTRLAAFRHESFSHTRAIDVDDQSRTLRVFSDHVAGIRLSSLLAAAEKRSLSLDFNTVRFLLRQLVRAAATWCETIDQFSHGAIGPERIIITPEGRLVVADCLVGAILEPLRYSRDRYWNELRVPLPPPPAAPMFDARTDIAQVGFVGLALVLGRRLTSDVYPAGLTHALGNAALRSGIGLLEPLPSPFRDWLRRAMQLDPREAFRSAHTAASALDDAIGAEDEALERDAFHVFQARCLALDVRMSPTELLADDDAIPDDPIGDDVASEVDLSPRIEALRAFLARYPLHSSSAPSQPSSLLSPDTPPPPFSPPTEPAIAEQDDEPVEHSPVAEIETDFASESDAHPRRSAAPVRDDWSRHLRIAAFLVLGIGTAIVAYFAVGLLRSTRSEAPGAVSITTNPSGVPVLIDSVRRGVTPLDLDLPPGRHVIEVVSDRGRRENPITIKSGSQTTLFLELSAPAAAPTANGELQVRTDPPSATVTVDGRNVGRSPVSVADLTPGTHTVMLASETGAVTERVLIEAGRTASLFVPLAQKPGPGAAGWISVTAPADVQVFEGDRFLGNNRIDRIMIPVGRHDLAIVNETLGYRERRTVQVAAGQVSSIRLNWPNGTLAVNAVPWAEVFVDGMPVGETPIGSVQVPIGIHEIVFRHPELGERRAMVAVTVGAPAKVGVDLRSK